MPQVEPRYKTSVAGGRVDRRASGRARSALQLVRGAMDWDDPKPKPARAITPGEDLYALSIGELGERTLFFLNC